MDRLDLEHPRGAGELLSTTFAFFSAHASALFTMTLVIVAPAVIVIDGIWGRALADGADAKLPAAATITSVAVGALLQTPLIVAVNAASVLAAARGEEPHVGGAFRAAAPRFVPAIAAVVLAALAILAGFVLLVIPGIYLAVRLYLAAQAAVVDGRGPMDALRRSGELVRGEWWPTFGCLLLAGLVFGLIAVVGQAVGAALGNGALFVSAVVIGQAVAASLAAIFGTLLFFDLRARKEARPA